MDVFLDLLYEKLKILLLSGSLCSADKRRPRSTSIAILFEGSSDGQVPMIVLRQHMIAAMERVLLDQWEEVREGPSDPMPVNATPYWWHLPNPTRINGSAFPELCVREGNESCLLRMWTSSAWEKSDDNFVGFRLTNVDFPERFLDICFKGTVL